MFALDVLGAIVGVALVVALPGWLLVWALFPRADSLRFSERLFLTIAGGILVAMSVGIVLGFLPHGDGRGFLQSIPTRGMPYVEIAMIGVCLGLFAIGLRRGAYPSLEARYPRLATRLAKALPQGGDQQP